jgi:hypothetical protein
MLHPLLSQLLVTTRHAELLAEAERHRLAATATGQKCRRRQRSWFPCRASLGVVFGATRARPAAVITGLLVAVLLGGCATAPVAFPAKPAIRSARPMETGSPRPTLSAKPQPSPVVRPPSLVAAPSATPRTDSAKAGAIADQYERSLVDGRWRAAWNLMSSVDRTLRGTYAAYVDERSAYFRSVSGRYTLSRPTHDPAVLRTWTSSPELVRGADLSRGYIVQASYPALANNNAGFEILLVAPNGSGAWRIWEVR